MKHREANPKLAPLMSLLQWRTPVRLLQRHCHQKLSTMMFVHLPVEAISQFQLSSAEAPARFYRLHLQPLRPKRSYLIESICCAYDVHPDGPFRPAG